MQRRCVTTQVPSTSCEACSGVISRKANTTGLSILVRPMFPVSGPEKGVIMKGVFWLEQSLESLTSPNSLRSLENGRILICFLHFGGSLECLEKTPLPEDPFF